MGPCVAGKEGKVSSELRGGAHGGGREGRAGEWQCRS